MDEEIRYKKIQREEEARTELLTAEDLEPEPEPEPEMATDVVEDDAESGVPEGVPEGLTMLDARELERLLAEAKKALAYEKTFDELGAHIISHMTAHLRQRVSSHIISRFIDLVNRTERACRGDQKEEESSEVIGSRER